MEIILNKEMCESMTGRLRRHSPWVLRSRNGKTHAVYQGPKAGRTKQETFRVFYQDLLKLQEAKYIQSIELSKIERRWSGV